LLSAQTWLAYVGVIIHGDFGSISGWKIEPIYAAALKSC